jgi:magnesium chelatase family protein
MDIIGLPASEIREARDRVRVAIRNSGLEYPAGRILVNLSPADIPKSGNGFDLAIAAAVLSGSGQINTGTDRAVLLVGEVHLGGSVTGVRGVLSAVAEAARRGIHDFVVPRANLREAAMIGSIRVYGLTTLRELPSALDVLAARSAEGVSGAWDEAHEEGFGVRFLERPDDQVRSTRCGDYASLRGLADLKRALVIAAAGGHHLLVVGPPGAGKSASLGFFPSILTPLSDSEMVEVARIHSLAGYEVAGPTRIRPFRVPHHSASTEGLLGGRSLVPGEVALAHRGTLFLDEALEFRRPALQGLREPLEHGRIRISRSGLNYWFPARFQLLLAANRCPCGMLGRPDRVCLCSVHEVERYWRRLGGPLLDRIDLRLSVVPRPLDQLPKTDGSDSMREAVQSAVAFRVSRRGQSLSNALLNGTRADEACGFSVRTRAVLARATEAFHLSTRASLAIRRVARTIADLSEHEQVSEDDVLEAVSYRRYGEERPPWREIG